MRKLKLHHEPILQGNFQLQKLNVLLVFQVNCPGCFLYEIPVFNELYQKFGDTPVSFLGLSTAFEDFDKNTLENTTDLLRSGTLVGETKKAFAAKGLEDLPFKIDFPVAMDSSNVSSENVEQMIEDICAINPNYKIWPDFEKEAMRQNVGRYLEMQEKISLTFTLNQLRGTPSIVIFDSNYSILEHWFGHVRYEEITEKLEQFGTSKN